MSESELDCHLQALPQCFSVRHFKCGWSRLTQVSGKERKQMARVLLGCLVGKVPNDALMCYRALLDFLYLAQYPSHDDDSLQHMEDALTLFHNHKQVFISPGIREHFNIPKFHSLLHYMDCIKMYGTMDNYNIEAFERLHIDLAKDGWRASNTRNAIPQMTKWLERQEKIEMFRRYMDRGLAEDDNLNGLIRTVGIVLAKQPAVHAQSISIIQELHSAPYFSRDLKHFLNSLLPCGQAIPRAQLQHADLGLGIDRLDVWHSYKLQMDDLGNDYTFPGMKVGCLCIIFKLPTTILLSEAPSSWPREELAYVEWYKISRTPGEYHNMYKVSKPREPSGDIVLLRTIRQACQLIPTAPRKEVGH
ncbi:hypothetical protein SCLCIDRAFT_138349 [Scleroderma citrinum Foug A]|uniref:Uncharacterized protein n=1 Tax=Scleroderma citrinum Foug A TaxID=1036808 RepID=A0A0C3CYV4_9AGAM|nr:hypothetical protein SCLCIDRAFT_138349 [Scleroderma citrinum Foug A]